MEDDFGEGAAAVVLRQGGGVALLHLRYCRAECWTSMMSG
jgi:hypothetical protein